MIITVGQEAVHAGYLVLINGDHPVREDAGADRLRPIGVHGSLRGRQEGIRLEQTCLGQLAALLEASGGEKDIVIVSGFRSRTEQAVIYRQSLAENGKAYTSKYVALPNHSEHQTGLAVDVGKLVRDVDFIAPTFPDDGVCGRFKQLAAEYGFIMRYQEGKEAITRIACEPWHYRFVGRPHAALIGQHGFCLEEYIDFVRDYRYSGAHLTTKHGGGEAEIYFVPSRGDGNTPVPIVACEAYRISGNNVDGFIVTAFHGKEFARSEA
ncbi:D-alanyl-D-alanine carboxypeptidase family protein [Paenibacillus arenilitoris]|nr:D-alanyl-D-alanine carboxypeptidase family protein [Paenibacillus arenilitoris]